MYIFGVDIPVVEVIFAVGVIGIILLLEITVLLVLITYHMKNSRRLEDQIGRLMTTLSRLNKQEVKELANIKAIEEKEESILSRLRNVRILKKSIYPKKARPVKPVSHKERKKMYKKFVQKKKGGIVDKVDKFLKGLKK